MGKAEISRNPRIRTLQLSPPPGMPGAAPVPQSWSMLVHCSSNAGSPVRLAFAGTGLETTTEIPADAVDQSRC